MKKVQTGPHSYRWEREPGDTRELLSSYVERFTMTDWFIDYFPTVLIVTAAVLIFGLIGFIVYDNVFVDHTYFDLRTDQWVCMHEQPTTTYVMSGKVMIPITTRYCTQYNKR